MKMGETNDMCDAVVDDLAFDPDIDASDITVMNAAGSCNNRPP